MTTNGSQKQSDINKVESKDVLYKDTLEQQIPFEQALILTGTGRYTYGLLAFTVYSLLAACTEIFSVGIIAVASQCDLDLDVSKRGLVSAVPMLGFIASAHIWGYLADTRGRKLALSICMAGTAIVGIVTGFINDWVFLTVLKFLGAFFGSGTMSVIWTILGESTPETHRRCFLLVGSTGLMFSQGINMLLAYPTLHLSFSYYLPLLEFSYRPWRLLAQIYALTNVVNLVLLWMCIYDSPKFYFSKGNHDKGLDILKKIYRVNTGNDVQSYSVKRVILEEGIVTTEKKKSFLRSVWDQTAPLFYKEHVKNTFLICYTSVIAYSVTPPFSIWLPEIFNKYSKNEDPNIGFCRLFMETPSANQSKIIIEEPVCDDSIADSTYILILSFAAYLTTMASITLVIIMYLGKKWTYIMIHVLSAIFGLLINYLTIKWGILTFILMMTNVTCMGITTAYAVELFPTYMRAMAVCLTIMVGRALSFVFTRNIGTLLLTNCTGSLYFFAAFIISGTLVALFLPSDKKKENKSHIEQEQG